MIDVVHDKCKEDHCMIRPSFNIKGSPPIYCTEHKKTGMINVVNDLCKLCDKIACFNFPDKIIGEFCFTHKDDNMIDVVHDRCKEEGCDKFPSFNFPGENVRLYCKAHIKENMINLVSKKCEYEGCMKEPSFGFPNTKSRIMCFTHKTNEMIDIKHQKCLNKNCELRPCYNFPTETRGIFCDKHKDNKMIDVTHKLCEENGCNVRASFGLSRTKTPTHCKQHKLMLMISMTNVKCLHPSCKLFAIYGVPNGRPLYCNNHKTQEMINIVLEMKCDVPECNEEYDFISDNNKYCLLHNPDKNLEIKIKKECQYCDNPKSKFICKECINVQHKKEWSIVRHIKKNINVPFTYDSNKMLQGCSKKRPDIFFELDMHCVIVEVDENQHKTYDSNCECARISEIVGGIGGKSIIIIRFNPDKITNKKKEVKIDRKTRLDALIDIIQSERIAVYDTFIVKLIQMYYDDNFDSYLEIKVEDITHLVAV
jgi:hypothetical protein